MTGRAANQRSDAEPGGSDLETVDAFAYWPALASRVAGLGGTEQPPDPNYIFHSAYHALPPGPVLAEIGFTKLKAMTGALTVRVFRHVPTAHPPIVEEVAVQGRLPAMAVSRRPLRALFEAKAGAEYAVAGYVFGDCEAQARELTLRIGPAGDDVGVPEERSAFGSRTARHVTGLCSFEPASLSLPVSQGFSPAQLSDPAFERWRGKSPAALSLTERWEIAYILQALEVYGRLLPGARGIGIAAGADPVAGAVAAAGCHAVPIVAAAGEGAVEALSRTFPSGDPDGSADFLWARGGLLDGRGSAAVLSTIEGTLDRLKPGGLAIHIVPAATGRDGGAGLDANSLNRVSLGLVAAGHIVAQMRHVRAHLPAPDAGGALPPTVPFGIIVRKTTDAVL